MVNMLNYFNKWTNVQIVESKDIGLFALMFIMLITATAILWAIIPEMNLIVSTKDAIFVYFFGFISLTLIISCFILFNTYFNPFVKKDRIIHDAQTEIKKELDVDLSEKQIRKLLDEQPTWANQLTKDDIKKHLN